MSTVHNVYHATLDELRIAAEELLKPGIGVLFVTQARKKLNQHYLKSLRAAATYWDVEDVEAYVQEYTCSTCSKFMARVGHLVMGELTSIKSLYWNPDVVTDPIMKMVVMEMKRFVEESRIVNVYNPAGPYAEYNENTNLGGKPYRHFYMPQELLTHRVAVLNSPIRLEEFSKQFDRVNALIRIVGEVKLQTVMYVDGLFKARDIEYVSTAAETLKFFEELLAGVAIAKSLVEGNPGSNPYSVETAVVNTVWKYAMRHTGLLTLRGSILGKLLLKAEELLETGAREHHKAAMIAFWKESTNGLNYRRTTAPASESQIAKTARFIEEGGWAASLKQVEAAEIELPAIWEAKKVWAFEEEHAPTENDFAAFAAKKGVETPGQKYPTPIDFGHFFNEVLPYVESMGFLATGLTFKPILFNRQADMESKPIFKWDTEEKRAPFIPWRYEQNFNIGQLNPAGTVVKDREVVIPVLSITTSDAVGYAPRNDEALVFLQFGGISMPMAPRPTLFAEALKGELYEHRRAFEDFSKSTQIPRATTQQSISMAFGQRHPKMVGSVEVIVYVRVNDEGVVRFGHRDLRYRFDANGWQVAPDFDKYPVITDRLAAGASRPAAPVVPDMATSIV